MGMEFFIVIGVFCLELLACYISSNILHCKSAKIALCIAFNKECLHNAVAFENFGAFINMNLAPRKIFQGQNYSGQMT